MIVLMVAVSKARMETAPLVETHRRALHVGPHLVADHVVRHGAADADQGARRLPGERTVVGRVLGREGDVAGGRHRCAPPAI